jgi:hypothetical protein
MVATRSLRSRATLTVAALFAASFALRAVEPSVAAPLPGAPACPTFPANSFWHADVSALPVHAQSSAWVSSVGSASTLKADFGSGMWDGGPIGIPFTTVAGTQPRVPVSFQYDDESDPGPYPIPADAPIEGGAASDGDRHVLVVDRDACRLWELYSAYPQNGGTSWTAGSGATWDLNANTMRPLGWTSGDAAGLPILPGLVRYDEVAAGEIDHVIRFTAPRTADAYVWPASHKAATGGDSDPPMGAWFRLKASFDISGYSVQNQVILRALKKHGMVLADNGSSWFTSGAPDPGWNDTDLHGLRTVPGSAFEAVDVSALKVASTSYAVNVPGPTTSTSTPADFDGDRDTDRSVYRNGAWFAEGQGTVFLGQAGDVPVPADYDGDGNDDHAVYRDGAWFTDGMATVFLGQAGDVPVPADYDGDGKDDRAVFRPSVGAWYIEGRAPVFHGAAGDIPVPGDYDGDGTAEAGVWRPEVGGWYIVGQPTQFIGLTGDVPVPGDYDANGSTDRGIWRPEVGGWYTIGQPTQFIGLRGDIPVPGDYDANGTTDRAIWRPSVGGWYVQSQATVFLGLNGDIPLPLPAAIYRAFF